MKDLKDVSVILPSLDPDEKLSAVIDGLLAVGFCDIILVNDGSRPENLHYFEEAAAHPQVQVLHHEVNRGKGAALKTAFQWFLDNRPEGLGVVTVDGDNQHHSEDTLACTLEMLQTKKVILGCRDFSLDHVPTRSRYGNNITRGVMKVFCGLSISDTQTGLRAIPRAAVKAFCNVKGDRFEYKTNMLLAMKTQQIPYGEIPIRTVYSTENHSSHFRTISDSARIYALILGHFFRYTISSVLSALVDTGMFALLSRLLNGLLGGFLLNAVTTGTARIVSSLFNFFLNQKMVFRSGANTKQSLVRYYCLAIPILLAQLGLTHGAYLLLGIGDDQTLLRTLIYVAVMAALYLVSFTIQQRWVFRPHAKVRSDSHE